jgi:glycine cleavage system H protein
MSELEYPQDLRYTPEHEWVRVGSDGVVRVGITAFAQDALGDVVYVSLPAVGDSLSAGDSCGEVESTKSVSDLFAPVSGDVVAVNATLDSAPELVNTDPYGEGWMYDVKLTEAGSADSLLDLEAYRALLA